MLPRRTVISDTSGAVADIKVGPGSIVEIGDGRFLRVRATPGHTPGCVTYVLDDESAAFVGDALLIRGCGRTDFQGGDPAQLYDSVWTQILSLDDATALWPGHDYSGRTVTSVEEEKAHNPRLSKTKAEFVDLMMERFDGSKYPGAIDAALPANMVCGVFEGGGFDPAAARPVDHPGGFLWVPKDAKEIATEEAIAAALATAGAVLLDVRGESEVENDDEAGALRGLLDGWAHVVWQDGDVAGFRKRAVDALPPQSAGVAIVIICRSGCRAGKAKAVLESAGFKNVLNGRNSDTVAAARKR